MILSIADPVLDEPDQPSLADRVEERLDVGVEHPVDAPPPDPERERVQRVVLAALRSEPVAEAQELRLVDRRQDGNHRRLDDLVLQGSDAERPLSAIRLGNVRPARWQRSVRSCMDAGVEVREVVLEVFRVFVPRQLVDARRGGPLQTEEAARRTSTLTWCRSAVSFSCLFLLTASRMRACAWDTASRLCVRTVLCSSAFSLAPPLRSTGSAAAEAALFARFSATTGRSDFSFPLIVGYGLRPSRRGPGHDWRGQRWRSPGSRAEGLCACQGLRRRGAGSCLAMATLTMLPSVGRRTSAPRTCLTPLNGWPTHSPVNASLAASRPPAHDSGPVWLATPSP